MLSIEYPLMFVPVSRLYHLYQTSLHILRSFMTLRLTATRLMIMTLLTIYGIHADILVISATRAEWYVFLCKAFIAVSRRTYIHFNLIDLPVIHHI
jgi:hypothetical protein